ncbi:MAG: signal peptide peptidase SppA [Anaerovoracaceae bacterium]|jgi:protease-4
MQDQNQEQQEQKLEQFYTLESPPKGKRKGRKGLKIWLIVLLCVVVFGIIVSLAVNALFSNSAYAPPTQPYVGVLYVEGVIAQNNVDSWGRAVGYQHDFSLNTIDQLIKDDNNKGLILYVDSPGGGIYESDELYLKVKEYKKRTNRPVYAYMASMAASGGYYISAPADMIFANRNCWTGSIGVTIGTLYDLSEFLDKHGIKTVTITSGRNKAMGSMVDPLTDEQRRIFQSLVDEAYDQFVDIVAEERQMDIEKVRELADGRIYSANQALKIDLVDAVATYDEAIHHMADSYGLHEALLYDIRYQDDSFIGRLFGKLPLPEKTGSDVEAILSLVSNDVRFPVSYLCEMLNK